MLTLILMILGMLLMLIAAVWQPQPAYPRVHPGWLGAFFVVLGWVLQVGSGLLK
jgi:hypothetical protein